MLVFLLLLCILQCKLTNILHQSHRFCYEANACWYRSRTLLQIPPIYLFLATFSYLPNNFAPLFYCIFSFEFEISCLLECFPILSTYSFCTSHIPLNQDWTDQTLFLLSANNSALKQSIFSIFFSLLASIFHQSTSAHFFSFLKFSFFLHQGQLWKAPQEYSVASLDACSLTPTAECKIHFQAKSSYSHVYRILSMQFWICQLNFFEILSRSKALCYKFWTVQPVINMFKV